MGYYNETEIPLVISQALNCMFTIIQEIGPRLLHMVGSHHQQLFNAESLEMNPKGINFRITVKERDMNSM